MTVLFSGAGQSQLANSMTDRKMKGSFLGRKKCFFLKEPTRKKRIARKSSRSLEGPRW